MKSFLKGEKVLFIEGDHKGKFGYYMHHERDSGYLVPLVSLDGEYNVAKPRDREIISYKEISERVSKANKELAESVGLMDFWYDSK